MRKKYINSNKTDVNTIYYRDKKGKILASSSTYRITSEKKLSKFSLILGLLSLFIILSSMFLTGYIDSAYEDSYVPETKVIEYQKIVGYEVEGTNFDNFSFDNYYDYFNSNNKLYLKDNINFVNDFLTYDYYYSHCTIDFTIRLGKYYGYRFYNDVSYSLNPSIYISATSNTYSSVIDTMYIICFAKGSSGSNIIYPIFAYDIIGNYLSNKNIVLQTDYDYFKIYAPSYSQIDAYKYDVVMTGSNASYFTYDKDYLVKSVLNQLFILNASNPIPIYETYFSYEYPTGYFDYDWNVKLEQLSKLRNVFNIGMIDFDKNLYYVNNYKYVRGTKNDGLQYSNYNILFDDVNVQKLQPYCYVALYQSWDEKIGSGKRDDYYLWYVWLNELDDNATDEQRKVWNYIKDNYITQYTLNNYINYYALKQYEGFYKFTQVLTFPINIINNLMYDFGVLVRFVVDW